MLDPYRRHTDETHPLVDHPTRRALRLPIAEKEEAIAWGQAALDAHGVDNARQIGRVRCAGTGRIQVQ